jgi:hypothetical protein
MRLWRAALLPEDTIAAMDLAQDIISTFIILISVLALLISMFLMMFYGAKALREVHSSRSAAARSWGPLVVLLPHLFDVEPTPLLRRARLFFIAFAISLSIVLISYPFP